MITETWGFFQTINHGGNRLSRLRLLFLGGSQLCVRLQCGPLPMTQLDRI
jgi:hypothetical protein